ncbi:hypothetical protein [Paenibacillus glycinis]|uniref:Uncharacterized protein n=1 Tax=Paenibacillus glycinis TaxID=2697035 RepID=A0ABW9XSG3_9BACL|nr:hypothetical protein [Paenibacillus glycinis]NBD25289.1 hypothetical protein [Paenibacillus glycinis]
MMNHYVHQNLADMKEKQLQKLAAEQWKLETPSKTRAISHKGMIKRMQALMTALFA